MHGTNIYKKKQPRRKSTVDFTQEAFTELQNFKKRMNTDASNSMIINELIMIFLALPEKLKSTIVKECQEAMKQQKQRYASVNKPEEIKKIDMEIAQYQRIIAFLHPEY